MYIASAGSKKFRRDIKEYFFNVLQLIIFVQYFAGKGLRRGQFDWDTLQDGRVDLWWESEDGDSLESQEDDMSEESQESTQVEETVEESEEIKERKWRGPQAKGKGSKNRRS